MFKISTLFRLSMMIALCWEDYVFAKDECRPVTWEKNSAQKARAIPTTTSDQASETSGDFGRVIQLSAPSPGEVNCRMWMFTGAEVNYYTCKALADAFQITVERFFLLNPEINPDCSNILPSTEYCVAGFIEPVRALDGLCGPRHNNATCAGMEMPCCNAETFRCGNSTEDCSPGTCYEGQCPGDKVYSTDGTCGTQHGNRRCAGKWGNCCNSDGQCGTGTSFCGIGNCQSGDCEQPPKPSPSTPSWFGGNTTDGTCGGDHKYTCNVVWGSCCNKDGICGTTQNDCGIGCQPKFGKCSSASPAATPSPSRG